MKPACLDHVSVAVDRTWLAAAGFTVRATPGAADHARVLLDGGYLEVVPPRGSRDSLTIAGWFLRAEDLDEAATALRAAGIAPAGPTPYSGADGTWLDLPLADDPVLPVLTRRVDPPEGGWPPAAGTHHANGAKRLAEVRVRTADPAPLARALTALGATTDDGRRFALGDGGAVVVEGSEHGPNAVVAVSIECRERPPFVIERRN
jgi:hypothetical protein